MIQSITIFLVVLLVATFTLLTASMIRYTFIFDFVKGIVVGALYNADEYPDEEVTEHTVQIALFFFTFSFIWETYNNNNNNSNNSYAS